MQPNHLLGYRRTYIQVSFNNISDLLAVRKVLQPIAEANKKNQNAMDAYMEVARLGVLGGRHHDHKTLTYIVRLLVMISLTTVMIREKPLLSWRPVIA